MAGLRFGFGLTLSARGGKRWEPLDLFRGSYSGFLYDFADPANMRQESTGVTPVTADGQSVGLVFDTSQWGGRTLEQVLAGQADLIVNGDMSAGTSPWTIPAGNGSLSVVDGRLRVTTTATASPVYVSQSIATVIGRWYRLVGSFYTVSGVPSTRIVRKSDNNIAGSNLVDAAIGSGGNVVDGAAYFRATATTTYIILQVNVPGTVQVVDFDNISVKAVPGNHASQSTSAARPKYDTDNGGCLRPDASDDNLLTNWTCGADGNSMLARVKVPASIASAQIVMGASGNAAGRFFWGFNTSGHLIGGVGSDSTDVVVLDATDYRGVTGTFGLVEDGSEWGLYLDGAELATGTRNGTPTTAIPWRLFALNNNGTAAQFCGVDVMDMLGVNRALTPAEIRKLSTYWSTH